MPCAMCGSDRVQQGIFPDTMECMHCRYTFAKPGRVIRDEFGDEIDFNERKAEGMW